MTASEWAAQYQALRMTAAEALEILAVAGRVPPSKPQAYSAVSPPGGRLTSKDLRKQARERLAAVAKMRAAGLTAQAAWKQSDLPKGTFYRYWTAAGVLTERQAAETGAAEKRREGPGRVTKAERRIKPGENGPAKRFALIKRLHEAGLKSADALQISGMARGTFYVYWNQVKALHTPKE